VRLQYFNVKSRRSHKLALIEREPTQVILHHYQEIMANPGRDNLSLKEDSAKVGDTSEMSSLSPIIGNDDSSSKKS